MFPVYFQGSVVGAIMGLALIIVLGTALIRSKAEWLGWFSKKYRCWITAAILVAWCGSFVNIGIHNVQGDRARFDQAGTLTEKTAPVKVESASPESAKQAAADLRKEIDAGNLNK
ncbi:hypothetical protein D3C87_1070720 [compost metagenome]